MKSILYILSIISLIHAEKNYAPIDMGDGLIIFISYNLSPNPVSPNPIPPKAIPYSDAYKIQTVSYDANGPTCSRPGIVVSGDDVIVCSWLCGIYEGSDPSLVVVSFIKEEESTIWNFDDISIHETDFNCYN